jgi:hypothetical protein
MKLFIIGLGIISSLSFSTFVSAQTNSELNAKIDALADQLEKVKSSGINSRLSIGGYGEIIYSKTEEGEEGTVGSDPVFDNKRFILYIGYEFSKKWKLVSEIEVEHANEIYTEQAYLEFKQNKKLSYRVGTLLIPMGHLNLTHEPTTYFGAQRTQVETRIIPSTWRENGFGIYGEHKKFKYHLYYVTGLVATTGTKDVNASGVRNGRQKASKAKASKGAFVGRVDYHPESNIEIGASIYTGKLNSTNSDVGHNVYDIHYKGTFGAIYTRALWTQLSLTNTEELNAEISSDVAEKMNGHYFEVGYDIMHGKSEWKIIPFVRYEAINTHAEVADGTTKDKSQDQVHSTFGVTLKPLVNITLKADYTKTTNEAKSGTDSWNLGVGWNF